MDISKVETKAGTVIRLQKSDGRFVTSVQSGQNLKLSQSADILTGIEKFQLCVNYYHLLDHSLPLCVQLEITDKSKKRISKLVPYDRVSYAIREVINLLPKTPEKRRPSLPVLDMRELPPLPPLPPIPGDSLRETMDEAPDEVTDDLSSEVEEMIDAAINLVEETEDVVEIAKRSGKVKKLIKFFTAKFQ